MPARTPSPSRIVTIVIEGTEGRRTVIVARRPPIDPHIGTAEEERGRGETGRGAGAETGSGRGIGAGREGGAGAGMSKLGAVRVPNNDEIIIEGYGQTDICS